MKIIPYLKFDQSLQASAAASFTQIVFIHAEYYKVYFKEKFFPYMVTNYKTIQNMFL